MPHVVMTTAPATRPRHRRNRIREFREKRGLTLHQLAEMTGVKYQTIQKYELRERNITIERLEDIARALGVQPWDLIPPE